MVQAIVSTNLQNSLGFGKIFNLTLPNFQATATAAYRPRDICVILDYLRVDAFRQLAGNALFGQQPVVQQPGVGSAHIRRSIPSAAPLPACPRAQPRPPMETRIFPSLRPTAVRRSYRTSIPIAPARRRLFRRPVELRHDAGRRYSLQEQLGDQRLLCPDRRPSAEHRQPGNLDLQFDFRNQRLCRLRRHDLRHVGFPGLDARAGLLGQEVLLLAARSDQ